MAKARKASSNKQANARISFSSERLLEQAMAGLLTRMPGISGVQILHANRESGIDIIFNSEGGLGEQLLCACLVKNRRITGNVATHTGARALYFQAEQALGSKYTTNLGIETKIERVYVVTPYDLSPLTLSSIRGKLRERAAQLNFIGGSQLFDLFKKYWPDYVPNETSLTEDNLEQFDQSNEIEGTALSRRLRSALAKRGMTIRHLADSLAVSTSTVSRIMSGRTKPSAETLERITSILNTRAEDTTEGKGSFGRQVFVTLPHLGPVISRDFHSFDPLPFSVPG